jgi:hypothetical protein
MSMEFEHSPYYEARRTFKGMRGLMPEVIRPSTTQGLKYATESIEARTASFQSTYLASHPERQSDERVTGLFEDMNNAGYWHILDRIDGYDALPFSGNMNAQEVLEQARATREWAQANFTQEELREILGIVVDTALMGVYSDRGQPGFKHGHDIMYSHIVTKPESMFAELPTPALIKRLNNGRFWENLADLHEFPDAHSDEVADVLTNHGEDLDPDFFEQGYEIFKRGDGEHDILVPNLSSLTSDEAALYWQFVQTLDQSVYQESDRKERERAHSFVHEVHHYVKPSDTDSRIAFLVKPYLRYIHTPAPEEGRKFDEEIMAERFSDSVLQKYLESSDMLRADLASDLQDYLAEAPDYVGSILRNIPQPREMVSRLLADARSSKPDHWSKPSKSTQLKGISRVLRVTGIDLRDLLDPNDAPLAKPVKV